MKRPGKGPKRANGRNPTVRVRPFSYQPKKAEQEADTRIPSTPEALARSVNALGGDPGRRGLRAAPLGNLSREKEIECRRRVQAAILNRCSQE